MAAELGARGVAELGQVIAIDEHTASRGLRQSADDVKKRRLPTARWAHDRDRFSRQYFKVNAAQRRHFHFASPIELPQTFGFEYRLQIILPWRNQCAVRWVYCSRDCHALPSRAVRDRCGF